MTQASNWMGIKYWLHLVSCPVVSYHLLKSKWENTSLLAIKFPVSAHTVFGSWGVGIICVGDNKGMH